MVFNGHAHGYERKMPDMAGVVSYVQGNGAPALAQVSGRKGYDLYAIGAEGTHCGGAPSGLTNDHVYGFSSHGPWASRHRDAHRRAGPDLRHPLVRLPEVTARRYAQAAPPAKNDAHAIRCFVPALVRVFGPVVGGRCGTARLVHHVAGSRRAVGFGRCGRCTRLGVVLAGPGARPARSPSRINGVLSALGHGGAVGRRRGGARASGGVALRGCR